MPNQFQRDWRSILADAVARNITQADLAREQGVSRACVCQRASAHGFELPRAKIGRKPLTTTTGSFARA